MWLALLLLILVGTVEAGQLDASWIAPTTNTNGTPLTDLTSYRVYWSLSPNVPCPGPQFIVVNAPTTTANLGGLTQGMTYNAQVTAVNSFGNESVCSLMASAVARPDSTWVFCANENELCAFTGTRIVRYGAGTTFFTGTFTDGVGCVNAVFGDPANGILKHCDIQANTGIPPDPVINPSIQFLP